MRTKRTEQLRDLGESMVCMVREDGGLTAASLVQKAMDECLGEQGLIEVALAMLMNLGRVRLDRDMVLQVRPDFT